MQANLIPCVGCYGASYSREKCKNKFPLRNSKKSCVFTAINMQTAIFVLNGRNPDCASKKI